MDLTKVGTERTQQSQVSEQSAAQKSQTAKEVSQDNKAQAAQHGTSTAKSSVKWSPESQLLSEGLSLAKSAPDARADKVAQIKLAMENGTYKIDANKIADRMIQSSLEDDLATRNG